MKGDQRMTDKTVNCRDAEDAEADADESKVDSSE
jgi:hypothetical protein